MTDALHALRPAFRASLDTILDRLSEDERDGAIHQLQAQLTYLLEIAPPSRNRVADLATRAILAAACAAEVERRVPAR